MNFLIIWNFLRISRNHRMAGLKGNRARGRTQQNHQLYTGICPRRKYFKYCICAECKHWSAVSQPEWEHLHKQLPQHPECAGTLLCLPAQPASTQALQTENGPHWGVGSLWSIINHVLKNPLFCGTPTPIWIILNYLLHNFGLKPFSCSSLTSSLCIWVTLSAGPHHMATLPASVSN